MRDKLRFVAILGVSLGLASLALTIFAFVYVLIGHQPISRLDHRGARSARRFSLCWSGRRRGGEGTGSAVTEERNVEPFLGVALRGSATVHIAAGAPPSLSVRARPGVVPDVVTEVKNGELVVWERRPSWFPQSIDVYAVMEDLESLSVSGSGRIQSEGALPGDELRIAVSGSGSVAATVEADSIESRVTGSGRLTLSGKARSHQATVSGSGSIEGFGLETEKTVVSVTGSGRALVNVAEDLDVAVTGRGNVRYKGDPKVSKRITGSGTVIRSPR
jgi:hypothetical protein